jgi:hypothetical protein
MIATILTKSSNFHAVEYNERKVQQGKAVLLEMSNFSCLQRTDDITPEILRDYLITYSSVNENIKYPQFHVVFSCKGHDYTPEQLCDIAHRWLKEMGYGEEGQPLLIYSHHDTKNTHIHIVTSRIAPDGHKIDHNNERIRSQQVLNRIMNVDRGQETTNVITRAYRYSFSTIGQFQSILECSGYETYKEDDSIKVKKDGVVIDQVPFHDIEQHFTPLDKKESLKRRRQLKAILQKYRDLSTNKTELKKVLHSKFGIDIVFAGSKDAPHGFTLVDHSNRIVYKGSDVMDINELLQFSNADRDKTPENIIGYIKMQMEKQPDISTFEVSEMLQRKYNAYIKTGEELTSRDTEKSGKIVVGNKEFMLDQDIYEQLRMNGRIKWFQSFHPTSEAEKSVLLQFGHIKDASRLTVEDSNDRDKVKDTITKIEDILANHEGSLFGAFNQNDLKLYHREDKYIVLDWKNKTILDLKKEGVDMSMIISAERQLLHGQVVGTAGANICTHGQNEASSLGIGQNRMNVLKPNGGRGNNREWEVEGRDEDFDDERTLKR